MNLFELFVKIGVDDQASNKIEKLSSWTVAKGQLMADAMKASFKAITEGFYQLTKSAVDNYAEYEQLVGGAELMFGGAFKTVEKNAQEAYETVQMSQSEYLKQVNGFATGLKTALGGNEEAAADLAHKIVKAEADIIAATGNTAENVQNAFNGIMRSNFTMLDNLQIGITPTKEGFQELIDKVNKWNETNGKATSYQLGNLADMQSALIDYIDMVGYSGYASAEAAGTISGSVASMKSAWQNLITGIADENADFEVLISNFVESVGTAADNILPRIEKTLGGIGQLIEKLAPIIIEKLPSVVETVIPSLLSAAVQMVDSVVGITPSLVGEIVLALIDSAPLLIESGIALIDSLIQAFTDSKDTLVDGAFQIINMLIVAIGDLLPDLVVLGGDLLISIIDGIIENLPTLVETALTLIEKLASGVTQYLPELSETLIGLLEYIVSVLTDDKNLDVILDSALAIMLALAGFIVDVLPELVDAAVQIITKLVEYLLEPDNMEKLGKGALDIVLALAEALIKSAGSILGGVGKIISTITDAIENTDWKKTGKDIINAIWEGLKEMWSNVTDWFDNNLDNIVGGFEDAVNTIKRLLGFETESDGKIDAKALYRPESSAIGAQTWSRTEDLMGSAGIVINQNIYSQAQTAADLAQETQWEAQRVWVSQTSR